MTAEGRVLPRPTCSWYRRWYHRRQREADVEVMFESILKSCKEMYTNSPGLAWREAIAAFDRFKRLPGQDHWHCPCAHRDAEATLDPVVRIPQLG